MKTEIERLWDKATRLNTWEAWAAVENYANEHGMYKTCDRAIEEGRKCVQGGSVTDTRLHCSTSPTTARKG